MLTWPLPGPAAGGGARFPSATGTESDTVSGGQWPGPGRRGRLGMASAADSESTGFRLVTRACPTPAVARHGRGDRDSESGSAPSQARLARFRVQVQLTASGSDWPQSL